MDADAKRLRFFTALCTRSRSNAKGRNISHSITGQNLLDCWNRQQGRCYYTGRELVLERAKGSLRATINQAGIERVRSDRGYSPSNVRLVCKAVNYMKNTLSREEFFALCRDVVVTWPAVSTRSKQ